tara:strand:- start:578 stop:1507 length:930 start_codon:yes stop_codon:yes gene_type:complete
MKRALVTGAAGFLGSHLCDELLRKGYYVAGVDNFFRGKKENLPLHPNFTFYERDLTKELIPDVMVEVKPDIVFHYAAINGTQYFYDIPNKVFDDNIEMTKNVLNSMRYKFLNIKKLVYTSTSEVYGDNPPLPTESKHPITLNVHSDRDSYTSSKAIGEFYVKYYCQKMNIDYLILRPFNTYGSRMDGTKYGQVIPEFIRKMREDETFTIIGDGTQTRSFCHVRDHKRLAVMLTENVKNEIVNIGYDEIISILDLAKMMYNIEGKDFDCKHLPNRDYDTQRRQPDISLIRNLFPNYEFTQLKDGLGELLK